jgi:hypothetical protein
MTPKFLDPAQDANQQIGATWTTTNDAMSGVQASYLQSLCKEAGVAFDPRLTRTEASRRIEELHRKTGRDWEH